MSSKERLLKAVQELLCDLPAQASLYIAYSGGLDSTVLAYLMCQLFPERVKQGSVIALHVHHGLQADADHFETVTRHQAKAWHLSYQSFRLQLKIPQGASLEAYARKERYACLNRCLKEQDVLVLGHHLDDQAETFLLQALRGSGVAGLASMPKIDLKQRYYRPLLSFTKQELKEFAEKEGLSWCEDLTNQALCFDRNFLRQEILPRLTQHFPGTQKTLARAAQNCAAATHELKNFYQPELKIALQEGQTVFDLTSLALKESGSAQLLLKAWLDELEVFISRLQLDHLWSNVVLARIDGAPQLELEQGMIRRFNNRLYYCADSEREREQAYDLPWDGQSPLVIPGWKEILTIEELARQGVNMAHLDWSQVHVHSRTGRERCHPQGRAHSQTLKKLFQEYKVLPWKREYWPIVSMGVSVVCVLDLFVCQAFAL